MNNNNLNKLEDEKYKNILDRMAESVWIWDEQERTVYANPNFCNLLWYKLEEIIWLESYVFRDEESSKTVAQNNELRKEGEASKYEGVLKAKDGTLIPVFCSWTPIPWWGTVWIMTDLRPIKSLQDVRNQLKDLNKQKDELISIIGHEFRTPLSTIKGYLSMILEDNIGNINEEEELKTFITHCYKNSIRLTNMLNDILRLSISENKEVKFNFELLKIKDLINFINKDLQFEADNKGIILEQEIDKEIENCYILWDKDKLIQVFINLTVNAIKFTEKWWIVKIIAQINKKNNKQIKLGVQDTWIWIPKEKLNSIFDKFSQVESVLQRKNTNWLGLWLSIVKEYVEKHNSKIKVESELEKGSCFYFNMEIQKMD